MLARVLLSLKHETILVDKYGEAEFTVKEASKLVIPMLQLVVQGLDTIENVDNFCERFEVKESE